MSRLAHATNECHARYADARQAAGTRFIGIPFFRKMSRMSDDAFKGYLLERMETSSKFLEWYNRVLARMKAEDAKEAVRTILRDEVPQGKPTHFEDLTADLERIGISKQELFSHRPSQHTIRAMDQVIELSCNPALSDLERLVFLHIAGEMLVSLEYNQIVLQIAARFGFIGRQLRFYTPHAEHDAQDGAHDRTFVDAIEKRITGPDELVAALRAMDKAVDARLFFFEQFKV